MGCSIRRVVAIDERHLARLRQAGIRTRDDLLLACGDSCGRGAIAGATGIAVRLLHRWADVADLTRIRGVGHGYAELLTRAGVDGVDGLRTQDPQLLAARLASLHAGRPRSCPSAATVADWIDQARALARTVGH